jgi:aquaporin Z
MDPPSIREYVQWTAAELLGTFILVFVDAGGAMTAELHGWEVTPEARALAAGLTVMAMIFSVGDVSGAHINPAVTFAFALRRVFPWSRVPLYWAAQFLGAVLAAAALAALLGPLKHLGANTPPLDSVTAFFGEFAFATMLVFVILSTATQLRVTGPNAAIPVGATVALCCLFGRPISDASMNPARSFGPALVSGHLSDLWLYLLAPLLGAALAVSLTYLIHGRPKTDEEEAAMGKEGKRAPSSDPGAPRNGGKRTGDINQA